MNPPILLAYEDEDGGLHAWCIHCRRWHLHGAGEGHRAAHCTNKDSPYLKTGYVLTRVGPWEGAKRPQLLRKARKETTVKKEIPR